MQTLKDYPQLRVIVNVNAGGEVDKPTNDKAILDKINGRDFDNIKDLTWGQCMFRRAQAIKDYLRKKGISQGRIIPRIGKVYPKNFKGRDLTEFSFK